MLKPYMPQQEIATMDALMHLLKPKSVLEFGAGGSTARWSRYPSVNIWTAIETQAQWVTIVRAEAPDAETWLVSEEPYDSYTLPAAGRYDMIFVDGKHRVRCVQDSRRWLNPGGVVILHDALRSEYADAWAAYPRMVLLGEGNVLHNGLLLMWDGAQ